MDFYLAFLFNLLVYSIPSPLILTDEFFQSVYYWTFKQDQYIVGISLTVFLLIGATAVQLDAELMELNWPNVNYPFKKTIHMTNREAEENAFGAHIHMITTFALCMILFYILTPTPRIAAYATFAVLTIAIFGDMFAAIIGKSFGKHKWSFYPDKSIEGTLGGGLVSFLLGFIFLGWIGGLLGCLVIIITDIFLPKITSLSDNILNPLLLTLLFIILAQFESLIQPLASINLIGKDVISVPDLNYTPTEGFYGSFWFVLICMVITALIGLVFAFKYRKNQIFYLFTGNEKFLTRRKESN